MERPDVIRVQFACQEKALRGGPGPEEVRYGTQ